MKAAFLLIFFSLSSYATDNGNTCPRGNFTKEFGEVRGSGGAEWCWANTAADLIGYAQGVKPPSRISTIDVAVSNLMISPDKIDLTVKSLKSVGMSESRIPWYQAQIASAQQLMRSFSLKDVTGVPSTALLSYQSRNGYCLEQQLESSHSLSNSYITYYIESVRTRLGDGKIKNCSGAPQDAVEQIQKFNFDLNQKILSSIERDLENQCKPRIPLKPMLPSTVDLSADPLKRSATDFLKLGLDKGLPMAIAFDHNLLTGGPYSKIASHVGIITESRFNSDSGLCEYRLRDSNGSDCSIYKADLRGRCDKGNIWLTSQEINDSTEMLMAVDKPQD